MKPPRCTHAVAKVAVSASHAQAFDPSCGPALAELTLSESFSGDLVGESQVYALQLRHPDGRATMTSVQRFDGSLGRRQGSFVLEGSEVVEDGHIRATWFVVPGSGTGELTGLRGEGRFEGKFGQGSDATLDYWFE